MAPAGAAARAAGGRSSAAAGGGATSACGACPSADRPLGHGAVRPCDDLRVRRAAVLGEGRASWAEVLATDATVSELVAPKQPAGWDRMDDAAKRAFVEAEVEKRTARLEVVRAAPNRFEAKSTGVLRFRLLLDADLVDVSKPVTVVWNGKIVTKAVSASKSVLLRDFVERFDRTYLPVVELTLP